MEVMDAKSIVLLGKTGSGKSSLGNTIFRENVFKTSRYQNKHWPSCQAQSRYVHGRNITLIDTPGFLDPTMTEEQLKSERVRCVVESAPGPHAFLIVIRVETFTDQEKDVIETIRQCFSPEAFRFAVVVFTHGDDLDEDQTIQQFVSENEGLCDLVEKCGGRCHVADNKYWDNNQQDQYRNNQVQVEELLNTVDQMVLDNNGGCYTNEMLQAAERDREMEADIIRQQLPENTAREEFRAQAKGKVSIRWLINLAGVGTGVLVGAILGVVGVTKCDDYIILSESLDLKTAAAAIGGVYGGARGYYAAQGANTAGEAVQNTAKAVYNDAELLVKAVGKVGTMFNDKSKQV